DFNETIVIKTDNLGNPVWNKIYNTLSAAVSVAGGIAEENDSLVVTGYCQDIPTFTDYRFIMKINKLNGNVFWTKRFPVQGGNLFSKFYKQGNFYYVNYFLNGKSNIGKIDVNGNVIQSYV